MRPKKVILLVDANEETLSIRTFVLTIHGYRVLPAATARAALRLLEEIEPGTVDLLIADLQLPRMDGNELVRRAREMHRHLPTLLISDVVSHFDGELAADALLLQCANGQAELLKRVHMLSQHKRGPKPQGPLSRGALAAIAAAKACAARRAA